jgi:hypothetical protein
VILLGEELDVGDDADDGGEEGGGLDDPGLRPRDVEVEQEVGEALLAAVDGRDAQRGAEHENQVQRVLQQPFQLREERNVVARVLVHQLRLLDVVRRR